MIGRRLKQVRGHWRAFSDSTRVLESRFRNFAGLAKPKIFCVGRNKTGTTSLGSALDRLGYRVGDQRAAELLIEDWGLRNFRRLIRYCHTADAFQDIPFSFYYTFQAMDAAFPKSKFILTIRDSDEQWYQSMVRFHCLRLEKRTGAKREPTIQDLKDDPYIWPGFNWRVRELIGTPSDVPFPADSLKRYYNLHNELVQDYFRHRPDDLLVLNVADDRAMQRLCEFLGKPHRGERMPKLNQSR